MIIYRILNVLNGKKYIGQTIQPLKTRWQSHIKDCQKGKDYILYRAMRKHGIENFKIEIIDRAKDKAELNKKEGDWILKEKTMSYENGYNCLSVDNRLETSSVTKKKHSARSKRNWQNKEYREKISKALSQHKLEQYKKEFKVFKALRKGSQDKGAFIGKWSNQKICAKDLKIRPGDISGVLTGRVFQSKGYIFEYVDLGLEKKRKNNLKQKTYERNKHKKFNVYKSLEKRNRVKGNFVGSWISQKQCAQELNICASTIPHCLSGKLKQTQGYIFEIVQQK